MAPAASVRLIKLSGDLDLETLPAAAATLRAIDDADVAVVDMRKVSYLDSSALSLLIAAHDRISRRGGVMRIVSADPRLHRLLKITGISKNVTLFDDVESALTT